ncbi:MAG: FtsX-like permease family protein [Xylophilus ampelinus]
MRALLRTFSWQEARQHPWRHCAAVLAVALGVALAFSVHLINASALDEFSQAVRAVGGQPDLELRAVRETFDDRVFDAVARHPGVALAAPVLEIATLAEAGARPAPGEPPAPAAGDSPDGRGPAANASGPDRRPAPGPGVRADRDPAARPGAGARRTPIRVIGIDGLRARGIAPTLAPVALDGADRLALFAPDAVYLNAAARQALGLRDAQRAGAALELQAGPQMRPVRLAGTVAAGGTPLAVMDIGAAQDLFDRVGRLTRIDLRLAAGTDRRRLLEELRALPGWPPDVAAAEPGDAAQRVGDLSRAYRVNLTVLALIALFTGAFLVYSVLALGIAQRARQFALLGVLGLTAPQRLRLVLAESMALGIAGSAAGIALGTGLAAAALRLLGGDLGGGYFQGVAPALQWNGAAALGYGALGVAAALAGGFFPARAAQRLPLAATLKGLGAGMGGRGARWLPAALLALGAAMAFAPPVAGIPLASYVSVGLLLVGGIAGLPWLIGVMLERLRPLVARRLLPLLALERARRMRETAGVAVSGVVAALALAVALTVMVASFRDSVTDWLDAVLPAGLYVRGANAESAGFDPGFVQAVARLPGVERVETLRQQRLQLDPARPAVALLARPLDRGAAQVLPMLDAPLPVPPGRIGVYVSEAMVDLYGARPGTDFAPLSQAFGSPAQAAPGPPATFFVAGVWRDYVRQFGAVAIDRADFERLTGDRDANDLALWLAPGASEDGVRRAVRALAAQRAGAASADLIEFASAQALRANSLRIFDRSFAVTYWLQAVAVGIGLFGVAASFGAQVLARRKEFGLLAHLGLTRQQILAVVAGEGAAWTGAGAVAGLLLGLAVSVVLVAVVNPQSFHWTMDLRVPVGRLLAVALAVVAAGTLTARVAGGAAAGRDAVMAVKEDW